MLQRWCLLAALAALTAMTSLSASAAAGGEVRSMPPAMVQSNKSVVAEHFFGSNEVAHRVAAETWIAPSAEATKAAASATADRPKPLQIGYPRDIPAALRSLPLATLPWQTLGDGSRVLRVEVLASDAPAFRIGYRLDGPASGLQVRFSGNGRDEVYASDLVPGADITWSPVLEGDTGTLELRLLPGFTAAQFRVTLEHLSHLVVSPSELGRKDIRQIGRSGSCNIDVACVSNPSSALLNAARAVAKMVYTTSSGGTSLCTGTLLNSTSGADYFYGAAHCISTQAAASSLNTYWFFDAVSCNSLAIPPYQLVPGGATLLLTDPTMDVTLLRLLQSPPTGAVRAAWNATVIPTNTTIVGLHHPLGDLKKFSQGRVLGYAQAPQSIAETHFGKDSFISVTWIDGTTEGGSSGSGLFTFNANCGGVACYELRGGLFGGAASCDNLSGIDRYSRMDLLYSKLAPYLFPSGVIPPTTGAQASMVEFYNPQLDFYFMTSREDEKGILDVIKDGSNNYNWFRSGYWFKTDPASSSSTNSISRYFVAGAAKGGSRGSHFYTALNSDRAAIAATGLERFTLNCAGIANGTFCNEGTDSFIAIPSGTGAAATCLGSQQPIYRVFRAPPRYVDDGNHRYLNNRAMYDYMVNDLGWAGESINFCARP